MCAVWWILDLHGWSLHKVYNNYVVHLTKIWYANCNWKINFKNDYLLVSLTAFIDKFYYKLKMWKAGKVNRQVLKKQYSQLLGVLMKEKVLNGKSKWNISILSFECMSTSWWCVSRASIPNKVGPELEQTACTTSGAPAPQGSLTCLFTLTVSNPQICYLRYHEWRQGD